MLIKIYIFSRNAWSISSYPFVTPQSISKHRLNYLLYHWHYDFWLCGWIAGNVICMGFDIINDQCFLFFSWFSKLLFPSWYVCKKLALGTVLKSIHYHRINNILQRQSQAKSHSTMQMNLLNLLTSYLLLLIILVAVIIKFRMHLFCFSVHMIKPLLLIYGED